MSYIEIQKKGGTEYSSFVKKISLMGQVFRIREHIGKNVSTINEKEYLKQNFDHINRKEFEIRKNIFEKFDLTYNPHLVDDVELRSIKLDNLLEIKEIKEQILIEFAKEFIFNSNNIEGSKIPAKEVKKIIERGDSKYKNKNEVKEVFNSIEALQYIQKGFKFNIASIKRLYYILTKNLTMPDGDSYPKGFKKIDNVVNNQATISPDKVEWALEDLLNEYEEKKKKEYPFKLAFDFHLRYEYIHPFLDGNGRTGRLIMNKILMNNRYFPIIIYADNSKAYFNAIANGLKGRTKKKYYQFMLEQTKKTYEDFIRIINNY
jgi:Fic family protein